MNDDGYEEVLKLVFVLFLGVIFSLFTDVIITIIVESLKIEVTTLSMQIFSDGPLAQAGQNFVSMSILAIDIIIGFSGAIGLYAFGEKIIDIFTGLFGGGD